MIFKKISKSVAIGALALGLAAYPLLSSTPTAEAAVTTTAPQLSQAATTGTLAAPLASKSYRLSSYYGNRCGGSTGAGLFHNAIDMAANDGTPIFSMFSGTVESFTIPVQGRTGVITINHGMYKGKQLKAFYAHMWDPTQYVKIGQKVTKGQKISEVGSSGISSGPHLHLTIHHGGKEIDPLPFLKSNGVDIIQNATSAVAKKVAPTTCDMYVASDVGLKQSASTSSPTIQIIKKDSPIIGYAGPSIGGLYKVKAKDTGKIGYIYGESFGSKVTPNRTLPKTLSMPKNVRYTAMGTWHFRDFPSGAIGMGGVLDTIPRGKFFTTTGRKTADNWYEVKYGALTGWVPNHGIIEAPNVITGAKSVAKNVLHTPKSSASFRSYPTNSSKHYFTFTNYKTGTAMYTTGRSVGTYTEVKVGSKTGWVTTTLIRKASPAMPKTTSTTANVTYKVKAANTDLRNHPSTNNTISWSIAKLGKNATVKTRSRTIPGWIEVASGSKVGWIQTSKITRVAAALPRTTVANKGFNYTVKPTSLQLRNYPSTNNTQGWNLKTIKKGNRVIATGRKFGSWVEVKSGTTAGWVTTGNLTRVAAALPKLTTTSKNVSYKAKKAQKLMNYPSTSTAYGWNVKNIAKNNVVKTTGRKAGAWIEVTSGSTKGWISPANFNRQVAKLPKLANTTKNVWYAVKPGSVQIRNYPSTNEAQGWNIKKVNKNVKITTTGKKYSTWMQVKSGTTTGWVQLKDIKRTTANFPKLKSTTKNVSYKAKSNQNIMNYPSASSTQGWKIGTVKKNVTVKTTGRVNGSFFEVTSGKTKGWVNTKNFTRQIAKLPKLSNTTKSVWYAVTPTSLQMRNYPSTNNTQGWNIKKINKNGKVTTTGKRYGAWTQVKSGSTTGWVVTKSIKRTTANLPKLSKISKNISYKAKKNVKLMNYPSTSTAKGWNIKNLKKYNVVKTTGRKAGGWIEVTHGKSKGWVVQSSFSRQVAKLPKLSNTTKNVWYAVKPGSVQIRNFPSTNEAQGWNLKTVKRNVKITTTGKKYGSWMQVKSYKTTGWVQTKNIKRATANFPKLQSTTKNISYKAKKAQKLMNYPSTSNAKGWNVKNLKKNNVVKTTGRKAGGWIEVTSGKTKGWIQTKSFTIAKVKTVKVKNYKLKATLYASAKHNGGKTTRLYKNKTVRATGWAYSTKVEIIYNKKKYWIPRSRI